MNLNFLFILLGANGPYSQVLLPFARRALRATGRSSESNTVDSFIVANQIGMGIYVNSSITSSYSQIGDVSQGNDLPYNTATLDTVRINYGGFITNGKQVN